LADRRSPTGTENTWVNEIISKILESIGTVNLPEIKPMLLLFPAYITSKQ
jgi:hypothetical protein